MKLTAIALAGGLLLAGSAFAADPSEDAAKIIQQIQAREAAKVEATVAAMKAAPTREQGCWAGAPGGAVIQKNAVGVANPQGR